MKWEEVRKIYPDRFVKVHVLKSHIENNVRCIDDMAIVQAFDDEQKVPRDHVRTNDEFLVYHTGKEKLELQIKHIFGFRRTI